jgi:nitrate reductase beta subunit
MNVRSQVASVFHLDKCIGCHTCSIACKNLWTDRKGSEYMWWNNVETKPGTGYPTLWEDQEKYKGGWTSDGQSLKLKMGGRAKTLAGIFHNKNLPTMDDYYEPWTYKYADLFNAPAGDDQPTARPVSMVTGQPIDPQAGPNWDDDLGGSNVYAVNDPALKALTDAERAQLFAIGNMAFFYLPRACNHCLNPGCVAACPSGAMYKRGEDGIVLVNQEKCRAWRMCVSGCPYKKVYYAWATGKSEKCIKCYPRLENGEAPACFHACVGRIRYLGVLLYDGDRVEPTAKTPAAQLAAAQREMILDPHDPKVQQAARRSGVPEAVIEAARKSPVYRFVKEWGVALPLHSEFRTLPMLFYVPPLLPVMGKEQEGVMRTAEGFFTTLEGARLPMKYMAALFAGGNEEEIRSVYRRLMAVRLHRRAASTGDVAPAEAQKALAAAGLSAEAAEAIYRMTALTNLSQRIVVPPMRREEAIEAAGDPQQHRGENGFGRRRRPARTW